MALEQSAPASPSWQAQDSGPVTPHVEVLVGTAVTPWPCLLPGSSGEAGPGGLLLGPRWGEAPQPCGSGWATPGPLSAPVPSAVATSGPAGVLVVTLGESGLMGGELVTQAGERLGFSFLESSRGPATLPSGWSCPQAGVKTRMQPGRPKGGFCGGLWSPRRGRWARLSLKPQGLVLEDGGVAAGGPAPASAAAGLQSALRGGGPAGEGGGRGCGLSASPQAGGAGSSPPSSPEGPLGGSSGGRCSRPQGMGVAAEAGRGTQVVSSLTAEAGLSPVSSSCFSRPGLAAFSEVWASGPFRTWATAKAGTKVSASHEVGLWGAQASFRRPKSWLFPWSCPPSWSASPARAVSGLALTVKRLSSPSRSPQLSGRCLPALPRPSGSPAWPRRSRRPSASGCS
uniref:Uncharacterized protein n=1 Tax=Mustela putorius furo TaxID=9669 RepID=M3Z8G3_MUSPF